ncbi:FadR/GntR family transcriptional regulator [Oceanobacillus bengalensis]|nr:FCD domain-containing protein [Oceanobacillus bengalensis]
MKKTQYHQMLDDMTNRIMEGTWGKGEKIPILPELASEYNVSVSTAREVLKVLESRRYITIQQGRGTFVSSELPDEEKSVPASSVFELLKLIEFRMMIEPTYAETAAKLAYQNEIDAISDSATRMSELVESNSPTIDEDLKFHLLIAYATHNDHAIHLYENLQPQLTRGRAQLRQGRAHTNIYGMKERAADYHLLIAAAIKERDGVKAAEYMKGHMAVSYELALYELTSDPPKKFTSNKKFFNEPI